MQYKLDRNQEANVNKDDWYIDFGVLLIISLAKRIGVLKHKIDGKGNVQIEMQGKRLLFVKVFFVTGLEKDLLSINEIMKHNPHLDVVFTNNRCYIFYKISKKLVGMGVEDQVLLHLVSTNPVQEHALMTGSAQDEFILESKVGHLNLHYLSFLTNRKMLKGIPDTLDKEDIIGGACLGGK